MSSPIAAIVNVVCQFAVLVGAVWLSTRTSPLRPARVRRFLWLAALVSPVMLAALSLTPSHISLLPASGEGAVSPTAETSAAADGEADGPLAAARVGAGAATSVAPPQPVTPVGDYTPSPTLAASDHAELGTRGRTAGGARLPWVLAFAYALGVLVWARGTVRGFLRVRRVVRSSATVRDARVIRAARSIAEDFGVLAPVRLLASSSAPTPFCTGLRRPVIVLPEALLGDIERVRMVVAHELAHIRARDHIWAAGAALLRVFLFWHPGVHVAWRGYRLASEELCDAAAVQVTGSRQAYVACLADMARVGLGVHTVGFAEPRGSLARRVHRVLHEQGGIPMLRRRSVVFGGVLTAVVVVALSSVRLVGAAPQEAAGTEVPGPDTVGVDSNDARWAERIRNLDAIHAALTAFRADTGEYPDWLSDLHPTYLADAGSLLDPFDVSRGQGQKPSWAEADPRLPVSYDYELTPKRRDSRLAGLREHGSHAPLVTTPFQREFGQLNLSVSGRLYLSAWGWRTLKEALDEQTTPHDTGGFIFAMDLRDAPTGFVTPARLASDLEATVEDFGAAVGDASGGHHAEAILRAWGHDREGAARAIAKAAKRSPDDVQVRYHYARLMHQMGRHAAAIAQYEHVIASNRHEMRQWEETHRDLSDLYAEAGATDQHARLIGGFEEYLSESGADMPRELLDMYMDAGMVERVAQVGPEALKTHANDYDIMRLVRDAHRRLGNDVEAKSYHRMANPVYDLVGKEAPDFALRRADGSTVSSADVAGSPVLLTLWWGARAPSHAARIAAVEALHQRHASDGPVVLGAFSGSDMEGRVRERKAVDGVATFPVLSDGAAAYRAYRVQRAATILIDRDGYVRYVTTDAQERASEIEAVVRAALDAPGHSADQVRIAGVTRDEAGAAVAGAALTLYVVQPPAREWRFAAEATSGADGSFDFGLHAASRPAGANEGPWYQVVAVSEARHVGLAFLGRAAKRLDAIDVRFTTATPLHGRVVDESGLGIAGARVHVRSALEPSSERHSPGKLVLLHRLPSGLLSATTDDTGAFAIDALPAGSGGMVSVRADGYAHGDRSYSAAGEPLRVVLPRAGVLTGRVYYGDAGGGDARARGVEVRVTTAEPAAFAGRGYGTGEGRRAYPHQFFAQVVTDAEGRYRIEGIAPGYLNIWAQAEGYTCPAWDTYPIVAGQTHTADLYLIEGGFIVGQIFDDATGRPVRPQVASAIGVQGPSSPRSGHGVASTWLDGDGRFRIRVAPGVNYAYIQGIPGWEPVGGPRPEDNAVHVAEGETVEVNFRVVRKDADAGG